MLHSVVDMDALTSSPRNNHYDDEIDLDSAQRQQESDDDASSVSNCQERLLPPEVPPANLYVGEHESLDAFLERVYEFYTHGGLSGVLIAKSTQVLRLAVIGALFYFLSACVDYGALWLALTAHRAAADNNGNTHQHVALAAFVRWGPLPGWWAYPPAIVFCLYGALMVLHTLRDLRGVLTVRDLYQLEFGLSNLNGVEWSEVAARAARSPELRRAGLGPTPLHLVGRIMRRDNYVVALLSLNALHAPHRASDSDAWPRTGPVLTQTLEWALRRTLLAFAFDNDNRLRPQFETALPHANLPESERRARIDALSDALAARCRTLAVIGLLMSPFVLCFMLAEFVLENGERCRNRPHSAFGVRNWSNEARWTFRDYNELPHLFRRRLARAYEPAVRYASTFAAPSVTAAARFVVFVCSALVAVLLAFGLLFDDDVLTRVDVLLGRSGVWWIGVLSAVLAVGRALLPDEHDVFEPRKHLRQVALHTHHFPRAWHNREHTAAVRRDVFRLFEFRWWSTARELLSVLYTPLLLWSTLPQRADALVAFVLNNTVEEPGLGHVCRFSALRVDRDGDPSYDSAVNERDANARGASVRQNGKLESSLLNFCGHYPQFRPPDSVSQRLARSCSPRAAARRSTSESDARHSYSNVASRHSSNSDDGESTDAMQSEHCKNGKCAETNSTARNDEIERAIAQVLANVNKAEQLHASRASLHNP